MLMFEDINDKSEMIKQLKEKIHETQEKSVKLQFLTLLPMSWSIKKIKNEFKASNYMVQKAKTLVKQGVFVNTKPTIQCKMVAEKTLANLVNPKQFAKVLPIQIYITKLQVD